MSAFINCIETSTDQEKNVSSSFIMEPLEVGQGITVGNALRRTLLSDISGFAITGVRINNLKHEFAIVEGVREDILEILLNLKEVIFQPSIILKEKNSNLKQKVPLKFKAFIHVRGPLIVTAGMLYLPKNMFQVLNPEQYICTLVDDANFYVEVDIENGTGYHLSEELRKKSLHEKLSLVKPTTLLVDAVFMPVKKVNYKIKLIHDSRGNIKESLFLEITTNGSISPKRSLQEAMKILLSLYSSLFITPNLLTLSSYYLAKKKENKK